MNNNTIQMLFQQAKDGDARAFGMIYESYFTPIFRFIYCKVRNKQLAEDLTQTVFTKIFAKLDSIDATYPKAYCYTVARNTVTDYWRKKKTETFDDMSDGTAERFAHDERLEEKITDSQDVDRILKHLDGLPDDQQDVIRLKFIHDLTNPEIAAAMDKTEVSVRQLQCRALKTLRTTIQTI